MRDADSNEVLVNAETTTSADPGRSSPSGWLRAARIGWIIIAGLALVIFVVSIPGYVRGLEQQAFSAAATADPTTIEKVLNLTGMVASMLAAVTSLGLAALLYWRKPEEWMALYLSFFLLGYGIVMAGPLEAVGVFQPVMSEFALRYGQPILVAATSGLAGQCILVFL